MKKAAFLLIAAITAAATNAAAQLQFDTAASPKTEITNGPLHARFYLPDPQTGYYRGTRFDWSGVIPALEYKGHTFFGRWNSKYDPTLNDAITGPVESFTPVGYDEAQPGAPFLQLGVGILTRPDTSHYTPFKYYPIQTTGAWNITKAPGAIAFRQDLNAAGYAYTYIKTISLQGAQMTITHTLKNTGAKPIESDVYNHNFFVLDTLDVGPGRVLKLPWIPVSTPADQTIFDSLAALSGDSVIIKQPFVPRKSFYTLITGYSDKAVDYDLRLEDQRTKVGVRIRGDRPLVKLAYWASVKTACPEPFIHVKAAPGETTTWTLTYDFYTLAP
jgi:hypothetical protein